MSDPNKSQGDPEKYPALVRISTEDLKRLLAQELDTPDDAEPDAAFMEAIMEVIKEREAGTPEERKVDVEAALQEFYKRLDEELDGAEAEVCPQSSTAHTVQFLRAKTHTKAARRLRNIAAVIVVFLAICGTASAFGLNILQSMAEWTADTFHFVAWNGQSSSQEDPFSELRSAVADMTDTAVIPNWAPSGTVMSQDISIENRSDGTAIQGLFSAHDGVFSIRIQIYKLYPDNYPALYQKDDEDVEVYEINNITHYIFSNNGRCAAAWTTGLVEVAIQGELTQEQLKDMIDSIYEE